MPFVGIILSFLTGGGLFSLIGKIFDFLKSPVGIVFIVAAAAFGGHLQGKWQAEATCRAIIQDSRDKAERIDTINENLATKDMMAQQEALRQAQERELAQQAQNEELIDEQKQGTLPKDAASKDKGCPRNISPSDSDWSRLH